MLLAVAHAGCRGGGEGVIPDPAAYLRVGVDPATELEQLAARYRAAGYEETSRLSVESFAAATFRSAAGDEVVRMITPRGIALATDESASSRWTDLSVGPIGITDHVVIAARDREFSRRCLALFRLADGQVREIVLRVDPVVDECAEAFEQLGGDATVEAIVVQRLRPLTEGEPFVQVAVPLTQTEEGWVVADQQTFDRFWQSEVERREESISEARARGDYDALACAALELALIAQHRGGELGDIVHRFDETVNDSNDVAVLEARRRLLGE